MEFKGKCSVVDKLVVSDPSYTKRVWCRYERDDINGKNWNVRGLISNFSADFEDITVTGKEFIVALAAPGEHVELREDGNFSYYEYLKLKEFTIGVDTACVGLGLNEQADVLKSCKNAWQPDCCLKTLSDGEFGRVYEGSYNNKVRLIVITGYLDDDTGYSMQDILDYLVSALNIELEKSLELDEVLSNASERGKGSSVVEPVADKDDIPLD